MPADEICFRCQMPILPGVLFTKARDGRKSHFACVMAVLGEAIDSGGQIGTPSDSESKTESC